MRRIIFTLFVLFAALGAAQAQSRCCLSYDDWRAGVWHELNRLIVEERSEAAQQWSGGGDWKLTSGNVDEEKLLKKEAFLVQTDTAQFLNLRSYKHESMTFGKNFTRAYVLNDTTLLFAQIAIGKKERKNLMLSQFAFGAVGGVSAVKELRKHTALYAISGADKQTLRLSTADVQQLLQPFPEVLDDFNLRLKDDEYKAADAIECLQRAGIIQ